MKVTILLGTIRKERQSHRAAYYVEKAPGERGIEADLIDLAKTPLPVFGGPGEDDPQVEKILIRSVTG